MRETLRNAIAHLDPTSDVLSIDDFEAEEKCWSALPVLKYMTRVMVSNELYRDDEYRNNLWQPTVSPVEPLL
jgi:hypothetical protein